MKTLLSLAILVGWLNASAHVIPSVKVTKTVAAPKSTAWELWTTIDGLTSFFGQRVNIELTQGGAYEVLFDTSAPTGVQGSEGCTVIDFKEGEMLQFTWNAPIKFGEAYRTCSSRVTVTLEEVGPYTTRVSLVHDKWGHGGQWQAIRDYFNSAWNQVMTSLEERCSGEWMRDFSSWIGTWVTPDGRGIYEDWAQVKGVLVGTSFTIQDGERKVSETLELTWTKDGVQYIPTVFNQNDGQPVTFKLVQKDMTSWTFENKRHDFPQRITYQRIGNELKAYLTGMVNGKERAITITYTATRL